MKHFVTGGTSSIGKALVKELSSRGESVRVLVRKTSNTKEIMLPGVELAYGDVTDVESVRAGMKGCARICHLAAVVGGGVPDSEWWRVNLGGTQNVLNAAKALNVESMVQVSSISTLMPTAFGETADESHPADSAGYFNIYQQTKRAADDVARELAHHGFPVKIVYPGYGYGCSSASSHPGMTDQTLLRMASGKPAAVMGTGRNRLLVSYFMDTARGILLAHDRGKAGEGYILGNANLTLPEIWKTVADILGHEPPSRQMPIAALKIINLLSRVLKGKAPFPQDFFDMICRNWCFSFEKATHELGFAPGSFEDTMRETWYEYQQQAKGDGGRG